MKRSYDSIVGGLKKIVGNLENYVITQSESNAKDQGAINDLAIGIKGREVEIQKSERSIMKIKDLVV